MRLPRVPAERPGDVYLSTRWQRFEEANRERSGSLLLPL
jgi:hypothetical protein